MALFVAEADCGRGVYSDRALRTGEVIERTPVLTIPQGQIAALNGTVLYDYWFGWGPSDEDAGIAGGYGSLYNHSFAANVTYRKDLAAGELHFVARRDIAGGEELRIDYTGGDHQAAPLWFPDQNAVASTARPERALAQQSGVRVARSPLNGRGVFALRDFAVGEELEVAPVIVVPARDWPGLATTVLDQRCYAWGDELQHAAFGLGCTAFYNHADEPTAVFTRDRERRLLRFTARRAIPAGGEITIDYRSSYSEPFPLWFEVR